MFFTSDLHFFHANILKWSQRPYTTAEEMNDGIIETINKTVGTDELWILGDVSFGNLANTMICLKAIKSKKIHLIIGNHDHSLINKPEFINRWLSMDYYKELHINKRKIVMSHYPIASWNGMHHGSIMLHGHSHGNIDNSTLNRIDVGFDVYPTLLHIDEVIKIIDAKGITHV